MEDIKFSANKYSRRIPYLYAKQHKVCIYGVRDNVILVAIIGDIQPIVLSEIKRKLIGDINIIKVTEKQFDNILSEAYSTSNVAAVVAR
jgi:hypothetical protein